MAKVLISVHLGRHFYKFGHSDYEVLLQMGHEVHVAANFNDDLDKFYDPRVTKHHINFDRSPFSFQNFKALRELKNLLQKEYFDLIHTQSPSGGAITRLAARKTRKKGTKVIYTAHGFHFHKGAPILNWCLYFPIELFLSFLSDQIITINIEDYNRANRYFQKPKVLYIPGIGINIEKYMMTEVNLVEKKDELGIPLHGFTCISVGELNDNKNHLSILKAISKLKDEDIHYIICGQGYLQEKMKEEIENLQLNDKVHLLGFRNDVNELYKLADVFIFPSYREGLGLAALEAMAAGLPLITSNRHGIIDYSSNEKSGYICDPNDIEGFKNAILKMKKSEDKRHFFSKNNLTKVKNYDYRVVQKKMREIYRGCIENE
ncbi:glycosyltransferase family 4 protein [Paenibacillus endoradicis]|uniref:glycosyltransferase family 4 protein n=1 Tax=Paenibacillus endoradicis TaxID=2972487 RepID=UPI002159650E|nr:glycosyltransferase family 4 protein [Paenibacillus endoradicis]MCR8660658.1 glycosyltransferase family 4 protein [Paenibacillus endoradicis]